MSQQRLTTIVAGFAIVAVAAFFLPAGNAQQQPQDRLTAEGQVRNVSENTLVVDPGPDADQPDKLTVTVPEATVWRPAEEVSSLNDLRLGDTVEVTYYLQGKNNVAIEITKKARSRVSFQEPLEPVATEPGTVPTQQPADPAPEQADVEFRF